MGKDVEWRFRQGEGGNSSKNMERER